MNKLIVIALLGLLSPTIASANVVLSCDVEHYDRNYANMEELNVPNDGIDTIVIETDSILNRSEFEFDDIEMDHNRITAVDIEQGFVDIDVDTGYVNFLDIDQWKVFKGGECHITEG